MSTKGQLSYNNMQAIISFQSAVKVQNFIVLVKSILFCSIPCVLIDGAVTLMNCCTAGGKSWQYSTNCNDKWRKLCCLSYYAAHNWDNVTTVPNRFVMAIKSVYWCPYSLALCYNPINIGFCMLSLDPVLHFCLGCE